MLFLAFWAHVLDILNRYSEHILQFAPFEKKES